MVERGVRDRFAVLLGMTLVLGGAVLTLAQILGVRVIEHGWPLLVIGPGIATVVAAYTFPPGRGMGYLAVPGAMVLVTGAVLEAQALSGDWQSWSYAWALVAPGSVGLGLLLAGMRERSRPARTVGALLATAGALLFVAAEWFFVRIAGVGGPGLGRDFGLVLPVLVITLGLVLVARGLVRGR